MKYLFLLLLSSCGIHVSSDPVIVEHRIDLASIEPYCRTLCVEDPDVEVCTKKCVNNFLDILGNASR